MEFIVRGTTTYAYTGARSFEPEQPSVVFVHGAGLDHTVWLQQSRWFAHHGFNALALDLPGHGRSGGELIATIDGMGEWLLDCIDTLGLERPAVVGHSMGSLVTLHAASTAKRPMALAGLLGIAVPMAVSDALLEAAEQRPADAYRMITSWGHGFGAQLGGNPAPGMWMTGSALRLLARGAPRALANDLAACNAWCDGISCAQALTCPALVLLGKQDVMAPPRAAAALMAALPDATRLDLDDCGHMMMAEQPDAVLDALARAARGVIVNES